jgi:hypothetical protein
MLIFVLVLFLNFYTSLAAFAPTDAAALKAAVGSCTYNGGCTGGCLGETPDGSCPIFARTTVPNSNPPTTYGVIGDWDVSQVTSLANSTFTPLVSVLLFLLFFHLNSTHPHCFLRFHEFIFVSTGHPPTAFIYALYFNADLSKWNTAAVTNMYRSTSTPLVSVVLSLEFHSLPLLFTFSRIYFWILSRHRHPLTAFYQARYFNGDISKWNTAAVTNMYQSTSTPPVSVVVPSLEFCPLTPMFFFFIFPSFLQQWLQTIIVRREMVTGIHFVQRHQWSVRLLRRGHLHGTARIKPLC